MKISEMFPRKYLSGEDLAGKSYTVTILHVNKEMMRPSGGAKEEAKFVLYFREAHKGLILSRTIAEQIAGVVGSDDTDGWRDKRITIYPEPMRVAGKDRIAVRVRAPQVAPPAPAPESEPEPNHELDGPEPDGPADEPAAAEETEPEPGQQPAGEGVEWDDLDGADKRHWSEIGAEMEKFTAYLNKYGCTYTKALKILKVHDLKIYTGTPREACLEVRAVLLDDIEKRKAREAKAHAGNHDHDGIQDDDEAIPFTF